MTELAKLYFSFWSKAIPFGNGFLQFFPEYTVPTGTPQPYGTYSLTQNEMFQSGLDQVRIWTRSSNIAQLAGFLDSVAEAVPHGGVVLDLPDDRGALWLMRGTPWQQFMPSDEIDLRIGYVNIETQSFIL